MVTFDGSLVRSIATQAMTLMVPLAVALFGPSCKSDTGGSESGGSSTGGTETDAPTCTPGETRVCVCPGGFAGVETCDFDGNGFSSCDCSGVTTATDDGTTTSDVTGDVTTDTPADSTDDTTATTGDTTTTDSGVEESSSTGGGEPSYQPCPDGQLNCTVPGEVCVGTANPMPWTACMAQDCVAPGDCPDGPGGETPECADVNTDGQTECYLPCGSDPDCPDGMECLGNPILLCLWPFP